MQETVKYEGIRYDLFEIKEATEEYFVKAPESAAAIARKEADTLGESVIALYLNVKNRVLNVSRYTVAKGGYNTVMCTPTDIFIPALRLNARHIILAHNHPSDNVEPSVEDITFTKNIVKAGELLGLDVLDHIIFTANEYYSFKQAKII